ncbi:MAG TPA: dTDP-4-amino-4,6-dideoxygalactose transaminase [Ramlibacter sp.]|uniref:dTDP-4-amino-4,6-dideoxygalactose transaminase n=1 Tax=Ramlibacter sp. TaxID=1917967 RepID=UPI002C833F99|nr:dTDP-4-amino-4,6-dideoxygalactose transaminase [Ramlibacter sp.]HVZ47056.1 dTDP-4-amino-4,6-dideoxygalactose transaminase [Ramlibacter sp.]
MKPAIPFNKPFMTGRELYNIAQAHFSGRLAGDGQYTQRCHAELQRLTGTRKALLTQSCTAALEMSAILAGIAPGDEVIMPSFTFVSTANAFVLRGGVPVFADVRPDTLNIDETKIEALLTPRTRAIVVVHYAGVVCEMQPILDIAARRGLTVIEDAAQAILSTWHGQHAGTFGRFGTLSFHETKNVISGEGGALLVNTAEDAERAEIVREKGTNRAQFFRGQTDKYTWCDIGSSFLPGELTAAFLAAQLDEARTITDRRLQLWARYHEAFADLESRGLLRRPVVPAHCAHNAHMYYVLLEDLAARTRLIEWLKADGILAVFHYVPLDTSPFGQRFERAASACPVTADASDRLLRLPLWLGLEAEQPRVIERVRAFFG